MNGRRITILLLILFVGAAYIPGLSNAQENGNTLTWLDFNATPTIQKKSTISKSEYDNLLSAQQGYHHQTCIKKKIPTLSKPFMQFYDGCWYTTSIGLLEQGGKYLLQPGASIAGYIKGSPLDNSRLSPTPNPDVFLELIDDAGTGYGSFITLRKAETLEFNEEIVPVTGATILTYKNPGKRIRDDNGSVHTQSSFVWYSSNAQWMVIWGDSSSYAIRINLSTFEYKAVYIRDKPRGFYIRGHAAISNDGRYIVVSLNENSFSELYIQDLSSCNNSGSFTYLEILKCKNRQLAPFLQNEITGYTAAYIPRFYSHNLLGFYHKNNDGTYTQYTLQAPNTNADVLHYLALGDSFASGEGAFDYEDGTDDPVNKCHLSKKSYPYLINQQIALGSFRSIACSGARIENIIAGKETENQYKKPLDKSDWHPGNFRQLEHIKNHEPNITTVSISGNDIGFADKIKYCALYANDCFDTYEDRLEIIREINGTFDAIVDTYHQIKQAMPPDTKIYAIGYPQIVSSDINDKCGLNVHLSAQERLLANQFTNYLNKVIKNAAAKAGVLYVGIEGSLSGNRLCEVHEAGIAVNGLTAGNDSGTSFLKVIGKESYHPNATGHWLMKNTILEKTDYFAKTMPEPDPTVTAPDETDTLLLNAPKSGRKINKLNYDGDSKNNIYYHNGLFIDAIEASLYKLIPFRDYFIELHSTPTKLGTVTSDINGDLAINVQIPNTIPPGLHTLHIYGQNTDGEDIDIYRYVYIGVSETDFDGDGIPNDKEACGIIEAAGIDDDHDGIDDACDSIITAKTTLDSVASDDKQLSTPNPYNPFHISEAALHNTNPILSQNISLVQPSTQLYIATSDAPLEHTHILGTKNISISPPDIKPHAHNPKSSTPYHTTIHLFIASGCVLFITISVIVYAKRKVYYE